MSKVDEFNDRADRRAENEAYKTRPRPRKVLRFDRAKAADEKRINKVDTE